MFSIFSKFSKKNKSFVGIDVGSSAIKMVQLSQKGGIISLDTYGTLALGPYSKIEIGMAINVSDTLLVDAIKDLKNETGITATDVGFSIPFRSTLISILELPISLKNKIKEVIPYEAMKHIPVPISEVSLDWFVVPDRIFSTEKSQIEVINDDEQTKQKENIFRVLLVAVHNYELKKYRSVTEKINMNVKFF